MSKKILLPVSLSFALAACGGGSTPAVQLADAAKAYTGETSRATLNRGNYLIALGDLFGLQTINGIALSKEATSTPDDSFAVTSNTATLKKLASAAVNRYLETTDYQRKAVSGTITEACTDGGTVTVSGTIDDQTRTGVLNEQFNACIEDGVEINGPATMIIDRYNLSEDEPEDYTLSFNDLALDDGITSASLLGTMDVVENFTANTSTVTLNLLSKVNGAETLYEDFAQVFDWSDIFGYDLTINGRIYDYIEGYVDIATGASPLTFSSPFDVYPSYGDAVTISGNGSKVIATPVSATKLQIDWDFNGDDVFEDSLIIDENGNAVALI